MSEAPKKLVDCSFWPDRQALVWLVADRIALKYLSSAQWWSSLDESVQFSTPDLERVTQGIDPRPVPYKMTGVELAFGLEQFQVYFRWRHDSGVSRRLGAAVTGGVQLTLFKQGSVFGITEVFKKSHIRTEDWASDPKNRVDMREIFELAATDNWCLPVWEQEVEGELQFAMYGKGPSGRIIHDPSSLSSDDVIVKGWKFKGFKQYVSAQKAAKAYEARDKANAILAVYDNEHALLLGAAAVS